jgi:hypothetical protein
MQEARLKRHEGMRGIAIAIALALISTHCHAQGSPSPGQCDQVRAAIAQHGLEAARRHAMAHHGLTRADIQAIEHSCGIGRGSGRGKR